MNYKTRKTVVLLLTNDLHEKLKHESKETLKSMSLIVIEILRERYKTDKETPESPV